MIYHILKIEGNLDYDSHMVQKEEQRVLEWGRLDSNLSPANY